VENSFQSGECAALQDLSRLRRRYIDCVFII